MKIVSPQVFINKEQVESNGALLALNKTEKEKKEKKKKKILNTQTKDEAIETHLIILQKLRQRLMV